MENLGDIPIVTNPHTVTREARDRETILAELERHEIEIARLRAQLDELDDGSDGHNVTKYLEAIIAAGNAPVPLAASWVHQQPSNGVKFGQFSVEWGDRVRLAGVAAAAASVAAYAERGVVEPGVTPSDYVKGLLMIDPAIWRMAQAGRPLHELCRDALVRCVSDERFAGADAENAEDLLETLDSNG